MSWSGNQDEKIVLVNVQAEKQFGFQRDELLGQKVTRIIPEGPCRAHGARIAWQPEIRRAKLVAPRLARQELQGISDRRIEWLG